MSTDVTNLAASFLVEANDRYCPIDAAIIPVENIAENVTYRQDPATSKSSNTITFQINPSDQFVGRDVLITWDAIPFKCTRVGAPTAFTELNFHNEYFNNYIDLVLTQFGLLAGVESISVVIDGATITTRKTSEIMEALCLYYSPEELARYMDASNHNIYYSNEVPATAPWIPSITPNGVKCIVKGSALSENDPFSATVSDKYNTRVPLITATASAASNILEGSLHGMSMWLPFNVLGISGDVSPLYHANSININVTMHANWMNRIFQCKRSSMDATGKPTAPYTFQFDASRNSGWGNVHCNYKLYRAPQYIRSTMNPATDKYIQAYSLIEQDTQIRDIPMAGGVSSTSITSVPFDLRAIPKSIVISLVNKRIDDADFLTDPVHFARWDSMSIELCGTTTDLASGKSSELLYQISKANGLELNKQQALYTLGFPVVLNTSDNLGCSTNSYVGLSTANTSGKYTLRVSGSATRLHHHTLAANFTTSASDTDLYLQYPKTYELRVIAIYQSYFAYNMLGRRFGVIESLSAGDLNSLTQHTNALFKKFAPKMNVLGGSWITSLLPKLKSVGMGSFRVIKDIITNKDGLRDTLQKSYQGSGFDNHMPLGGMPQQSNIIGGRPMDSWAGY